MTNSSPPIHDVNGHRQRGAATLLIGLVLVLASVALAISVAHTAVLEQRMARNTLLASQSAEAAQAGLGFASAWLKHRRPEWIVQPDGTAVASPGHNPPRLSSAGGGDFAVNLTYERRAGWAGFIRVEATASPAAAPEIAARVSQFLRPVGVLTQAGETAPPLLIDGCADVSAAGGLYPLGADTPEAAAAIATSADAACITAGALHGGAARGDAFPPGGLWAQVFSVGRAEFQALAAEQAALDLPPTERDYWWAEAADLTAGEWRRDLGRPERPIVLVIPASLGCPRFAGGVQLIGLVLIEANCTDTPAWGEVRIYGTLALAGAAHPTPLGPGSRLLHISHAPPATATRIEPPPLEILPLAGSWRDF
ncbi:MAG: hypothetical protein ABR553_01915 [Gammaproteobacteria bacterium]